MDDFRLTGILKDYSHFMTYTETFKKTAFKDLKARSFAVTYCDGLGEVETSENRGK